MSSGVGGTGFWHILRFAFVFVMISKKDGGLNNRVVCQQHLPLNGLPKKTGRGSKFLCPLNSNQNKA